MMNNEIYSQIELVGYKINTNNELECKGVTRYLGEDPTEDITEFSDIFCEGLVNNLTPELAAWHFNQNMPLATFYYNEDKSDLYYKTPYDKWLEHDDETCSSADMVMNFYNGTVIRDKETEDIIYV